MHRELSPKGLVMILSEVQGATHDALPGALWKLFREVDARSGASLRLPVDTGRGIPACALIGVDGTLRYAGSVGALGSKLEEMLDEEFKKMKTGWGSSADVKKARAAIHGKHDLAGAKKLLDKADATQNGEWAEVQAELDNAYAWRVKAVRTLREQGRWIEARDMAKSLKKMVDGIDAWETEVAALNAEFETAEAKAELARAKKVDQVLLAFTKKQYKGQEAKALESAVKDADGSTVAKRVETIVAAINAAAGE